MAIPGLGVGVGLAGYGMGVGMVPGGPISPMAGVAAGMSVLSAKEQAQVRHGVDESPIDGQIKIGGRGAR